MRGGKQRGEPCSCPSLRRKFPGQRTGRGQLNKQSWGPRTEAARVHRTSHLGGTCFTERKHGRAPGAPASNQRGADQWCARRPPPEPPESVSGAAPAAPRCWGWCFFLPVRPGELMMGGTLGRALHQVLSPR